MAVKIAINGFGRIGRNVLRAIAEAGRRDVRVVSRTSREADQASSSSGPGPSGCGRSLDLDLARDDHDHEDRFHDGRGGQDM